jgi:enoyl-[acyl-carrier protein] reductase II
MKTKITKLLDIEYPIIQGGMIWCSGWKLAAAVSNAGGLGLIGAGSMYPETLREHIHKCKKATNKAFGVNLPLIYPDIDELIKILIDEKIKIIFTSAGNPKKYTQFFKDKGIKVVHVVANVKFAQKAQEAGVDAIVAEGFEAGGHNGFEEITTMALIPQVVKAVDIPVIAAGGIATGAGILAALSLGAEAVQMGTRFVASNEASAHENFKNAVIKTKDTDTMLVLKKIIPVRLIKNNFYEQIKSLEDKGASQEKLAEVLGKARAKKGMFEGDIENGELEIGQIAGIINDIKPVSKIFEQLLNEFYEAKNKICNL